MRYHFKAPKKHKAHGEASFIRCLISMVSIRHTTRRSDWLKAVREQVGILTHASNMYYSVPMVWFGKRLEECSFADRIFLVNFWAEANKAAIKSFLGGLPIGAVLMTEKMASTMKYGDHENTFTSGALVCQAALTVLNKINNSSFLASVTVRDVYLKQFLIEKLGSNPHVKEIREFGLLVGVELDVPASPLVDVYRDSGLLVLTAGNGNVLRLVPSLVPRHLGSQSRAGGTSS